MLYVEKIENHRIGNRTSSKAIAESLGWTITIEESQTETAYDGSLWEKGFAPAKPIPTDAEISATREALYAAGSDNVFASYQQGVATLQDYVDAKAQISFDNKKSTQTAMTLDDFKHKVSREYQLFRQSRITAQDITYAYKESNGTDAMIVGDETISLLRPTVGVNVQMPKLSKVQIVKIDNVSEDTVSIIPASGDNIDGNSSSYILAGKSSIEFIADVASGTWDIYTAPLEIEAGINVADEMGNNFDNVNKINLGMGMVASQKDAGSVNVELDLQSLGIEDEPPCYYASISYDEKLADNKGNIIHDGIVWYDDVIVGNKLNYFDFDKDTKSIGIQEADNKDPNVTGGEPYLVVYRSIVDGSAPNDGFIESSVRDRDTQDIISSANNNPMSVYKACSKGSKYKFIRVAAILEAKNLRYLQHHLIDSFATKGTITLKRYTDGNSCMLIQGLSDKCRAGKGLMKYELDTGERVLIDKVWDNDAKKYNWILRGFETADETQMKWVDDKVTLHNPLVGNMVSYQFTLSNKMTKVPFGIVKQGDIPFDLSQWDKIEGTAYGNQNDLIAVDNVDITVKTTANLYDAVLEPVYLYLTEKDKDGNYKEIPNTRVSYTPKNAHEVEAKFPVIKAKVTNGTTIGAAMESTSATGVFLKTTDPQYSMLTFEIEAKGAV